ncbi:MAG TPA: Fic family protein [Acidothermales bacterium]
MTESIDYLTLDDVLEVADGIIDGVVVRDMGLLASAVARPQTTVFGDDAYPTLSDKAAALMHSLARNHALVDGNKRLAWAAARVFCLLNGHDVQFASVDDAEAMVLAVAAGDLDVPALASLLADHIIESA